MSQLTANPSFDAHIGRLFEASWADARDNATGDDIDKTGTAASVRAEEPSTGTFHVSRMFLTFDLSSIPADAEITSATLKMVAGSVVGTGNAITGLIVESTQSSESDVGVADFDQVGAVAFSDEVVMTAAQKTFTFTAAGLAYLQTDFGGNTTLAAIAKYDFDDTDPAVGDGRWSFDTVNHGTSGNRPLLTINYTTPTENVGMMGADF